jgi:hypothetical protein
LENDRTRSRLSPIHSTGLSPSRTDFSIQERIYPFDPVSSQEAAGSAQDRGVQIGVAAAHPDQAVRDTHQRPRKLDIDGMDRGREQHTESDRQASGEDEDEAEGADIGQLTVIAEARFRVNSTGGRTRAG